jgi:hypothetical protein
MQQPTTRHAGYVSASYTVVDGTLAIATEPAPAMRAEMARFGTHYQVRPLRNGSAGQVTDPQHQALAFAAEHGRVLRGGKPGQAPVKTLTALARRGLLTLTPFSGYRRSNWAFGQLTAAGTRELARLDAAT